MDTVQVREVVMPEMLRNRYQTLLLYFSQGICSTDVHTQTSSAHLYRNSVRSGNHQ